MRKAPSPEPLKALTPSEFQARWSTSRSPLLSVCCITFQHRNYIRKALDGFLAQKTSFPIEILIHDDASTDGTAEIVKEYAESHPDVILPILQTENQYSKGIAVGPTFNFARARGKYIAMCEGDDYWINSAKLEKQVSFLEANPDIAMSTHEVYRNDDTGSSYSRLRRRVAVIYRHLQLFGPSAAAWLILKALIGRVQLEAFDLTHRSCRRKGDRKIYRLNDFSDQRTHMSLCSIVIRRNIVERFGDVFHETPGGGHQSMLLMGAMSGGVVHFHDIWAVKNDQPSSVTQSRELKAKNKLRNMNPGTNDKLRRYRFFSNRVEGEDRRILEAMIEQLESRLASAKGR